VNTLRGQLLLMKKNSYKKKRVNIEMEDLSFEEKGDNSGAPKETGIKKGKGEGLKEEKLFVLEMAGANLHLQECKN